MTTETFSFEDALGTGAQERFVSPDVQAGRDVERRRIVRAEFDEEEDPDTRAALGRELDRIKIEPSGAEARPGGATTPKATFSFEEAQHGAGSGRGVQGGPQTVEQAQARAPRRGGKRSEVRPYVAEEPAEPPLNGVADEAARLRDTFFSGVDNARAGVSTLRTGMLASGVQAKQANIREAEASGDTGMVERLRAEMPGRVGKLAEVASGAAADQADAQRGAAMVANPAAQAVTQAKSFDEAWQAFKQAPYEVISTITAQSLPTMLPALVAGAVAGPVTGAATMGASSGIAEAGSSLGEFARDAGVDVTDPRALQAFFSDPRQLGAAMEYAGKRAGIIAAADAFSGGMAGKTLAPAMRSGIARQAINLPAQMGVQGAMGAGGEAGAQIATKGRIDEPGQVFAEFVGEFGGAPAEVLAMGREARRGEQQRPTERRSAVNARLDDFAAEHGLRPAAMKAMRAQSEGLPLAQLAPFYKRAITALKSRGLVGGEVNDDTLSMLDDPLADNPESPMRRGVDANGVPWELPAEAPQPPQQDERGATLEPDLEWSAFNPELGGRSMPREQMPQIKAEHRGAMVNFMRARGIDHETLVMSPSELKPTQAEFSPKKVRQAANFTGGNRSILVAADGHILDGHHQWLAGLADDKPMRVIRLNAPIDDLVRVAHEFPSSTIAQDDTRTDDGIDAARDAGAFSNGGAGPDLDGRSGGSLRDEGRRLDDDVAAADGQADGGQAVDGVQPQVFSWDDALNAAARPRILARAGRSRHSAMPIELRTNGDRSLTPYMDNEPLLARATGAPISVPAGSTDQQAKQAIRRAGAVTDRINFYPPAAAAAAPSSSPGEAPAVGARVTIEGQPYTIERITDSAVRLKDARGAVRTVSADSYTWATAKQVAPSRPPARPERATFNSRAEAEHFLSEQRRAGGSRQGRALAVAASDGRWTFAREGEPAFEKAQQRASQAAQNAPRPQTRQPEAKGDAQRERVMKALHDHLSKGGSLTTGLRKAGDALRAEDKTAVLDRARALRGEGKSASEAGRQAVEERIGDVLPDGVLRERVLLSLRDYLAAGDSLAKAFRKAGKALDADDKQAIYARAGALLSEGNSTSAAAKLAVKEYISEALPDLALREPADHYTASDERSADDTGRVREAESESSPGGSSPPASRRTAGAGPAADDPVRGPESAVPRDAYETDLFGDPLPPRARANQRSKSARAADAGNVDAAAGVQPPAGAYANRAALVSTRQQPLGHAGPVNSNADAANALAYLNRSAVERFDALVTDARGKPLAVIGGFKGALAQTNVYPSTLIGEAFLVPGAANLWLVHNHPSGAAVLSRADEYIADAISGVFKGSAITVRGMVAVTPTRWVGGTPDQSFAGVERGDLSPANGPRVPAQERQVSRGGAAMGPPVTAPAEAKALARSFVEQNDGRPGIVLLNAQFQPMAFVPWSAEDALPMRDNGKLDALYRAVAVANAGAAVIVTSDTMTESQAQNLGKALSQTDVKVLDIIDGDGRSYAERGLDLKSPSLFAQGWGSVGATPEPSTVASVKAEIAELFDGDTSAVITVVPTSKQLPDQIRFGFERAGAIAVTIDGKRIYIVADRVPRGTARGTVMHELGVHVGLDDKDVAAFNAQIKRWAQGKGQLADMARAALRYGEQSQSSNKAEEPVAYMIQFMVDAGMTPGSAPSPQSKSMLAKLLDLIRAAARSLGLTLHEDILPSDMVNYVYGAAKMALQQLQPSADRGKSGDYSQQARAPEGGGPGPLKPAANAARTLAHYRSMGLQALGRRQLVELYEGDIPKLRSYSDLVQQMDADKNEASAQADNIARDWAKLKDEQMLARLMHDATLAGIDAAEDQPGPLRARFKALSPEARAIYVRARDAYREHFANVQKAIAERIERADLSSERRQRLLKRLADNLKELTEGVYFPLARFGDYVVIVRNASGEAISVSRAENLNEADALRRSLVRQFKDESGATVSKVLKNREFSSKSEGVSTGFLGELYKALEGEGVSPGLMDDVGQLYLQSLPDLSWAKHGIHRKNAPGFSQDARRAFALYIFRGASHLAKLRYADRLQADLDAMQEHVDAQADEADFDSVRAQQVVDEMVKRHDVLMNPRTHPVSTALTSIGFVFHLGLSPASAMVNLAQTPLVAYPLAGAKWGYAQASKEFTRASAEIAAGAGSLGKSLQGDEADAYREAVRIGLIDVTLAHDLAGIAQGEDAKVSGKLLPVMRVASWMFHHAERINRETTFVAGYRLARKAGADAKKALAEAVQFTYDSHFDYSASNRPRVMQGNWQRVILLFKQFAQNMVFTLARQAQQSLKAADPAERTRARKALAGLLVMHSAAAGVLGLPLVSVLLEAASMIWGDEDEPWDAETALRNMLADAFGQKPAEVLARGLSRLTPWDISGRVGLDRLILPDVYEGLEGQRAVEAWFASALGPVAGIALNTAKGLKDIGDGHWLLGLEEMMPAALRGPVRAYRLATEGAQDRAGVTITDDISQAAIVGQVVGLSPSALRNAQEGRSAVIKTDRVLSDRRSKLINDYARAEMADDEKAMDRANDAIDRWNEKQPERDIGMRDLNRSIGTRQRRIEEAEDGVYLPRSHRDALDAGRFAREAADPDDDDGSDGDDE